MMTDMKQVKVDNWGLYFLQRLKHFFNRTDYCDLTLQFQDNAQLKVHRLVLNACTEYFELLERTCEMYEDCLIMPDDLQADVVVPIVNFMYTGQLEFKSELLDKLLQTSQIMNMPVLSKLLDAQRNLIPAKPKPVPAVMSQTKHSYKSPASKRPYSKAFEISKGHEQKTVYIPSREIPTISASGYLNAPKYKPKSKNVTETLVVQRKVATPRKPVLSEPRPTRYEVPEELNDDTIYNDSFLNISYESKPLMIHPESKRYECKTVPVEFLPLFSEASSSRKYMTERSTHDMVECRKISKNTNNDSLFDEPEINDSSSIFETSSDIIQPTQKKNSSKLFDQVFDQNSGPKVTIEAKDAKQAAKVDHAKIISEVLKKYPHLVNSNKNIKLKILETPSKSERKPAKKRYESGLLYNSVSEKELTVKSEPGIDAPPVNYATYEDVIDSQAAAKLIALGAENVKGPWICLICGTPGKALHFPQYYNFRRHLVEVHNEKPIPNVCEYCGLKSGKRNYLLHHLYTKHGVPPPASYKFPKCNQCSYVALTEGFLVKHKASHSENRDFRCNVCFSPFKTSTLLLHHIQATGHKYTAERKPNLQCIYCLRVFLRETNLYAHLKTHHRDEAKRDGIVDDSDEEEENVLNKESQPILPVKYEPETVPPNYDSEEDSNEMQFQIQARPDGNIQLTRSPQKQKILNAGFNTPAQKQPQKKVRTLNRSTHEFIQEHARPSHSNLNEEMMISEQEFIEENEADTEQYYIPSMPPPESTQTIPVSDAEFTKNTIVHQNIVHQTKTFKKSSKVNQPIEIVVSNEEQLITPTHPVIFDSDGNPSKTLAVLTTLDSAHSNEMMIIPDDYSLNVSQVDAKNSNIVVVYSHQLDDPNKQSYIVNPHYAQSQIITTQDLGTHFVQTSAVITPNYATVATTAPMISEQMVIPHALETYQENVPQENLSEQESVDSSQLPDDPPPVEAAIVEEEQVMITTNDETNNQDMTELTEMHIIDNLPEVQLQNKNLDPPAQVLPEEQAVIDQNEVIEETPMEVDGSEQQTDVTSLENNEQSETFCETSSSNQELLTTATDQHVPEHEQPSEEHVPQEISETLAETNTEVNQQTDIQGAVESPTSIQVESETMQEEETDQQDISNEEMQSEVPEQMKAQIENLASEWSEDEEDITAQNNVANNGDPNVTSEVEESIENIQQEMEKQITEPEVETQEAEIYVTQETQQDMEVIELTETSLSTQTNGNVVVPQEKISSLLNDWEDNDSQEDEGGPSGSHDKANTVIIETCLQEEGNNDVSETVEASSVESIEQNSLEKTEPDTQPKKMTNIKSLVSDWDEEDEEKA